MRPLPGLRSSIERLIGALPLGRTGRSAKDSRRSRGELEWYATVVAVPVVGQAVRLVEVDGIHPVLDDLLAIENQTDLLVENASPALLAEIEALSAKSGARVLAHGRSHTSLERLFLQTTQPSEKPKGRLADE